MTYNDDHVQFLSSLSGTTVTEAFLSLILPQTLFLYRQVLFHLPKLTLLNIYSRFAIEFVIIVVPQLAVFTVLNNYAVLIAVLLWVVCLVFVAIQLFHLYNAKRTAFQLIKRRFDANRNFISEGRGLIFVGTAICILAVDFQVFPRRFAKTEKYGFSIMDLGVGFFVVLHGYGSSDARGVRRETKERLKRLLYSNIPLIILGFLRLISVKLSGYHEHISEYGLHWNFFFTLAFVKVTTGLLFIKFNPRYSFLLGLLLIMFYQSLLNFKNYTGYVMEESLKNYSGLMYYIYVNRSGLFSAVGYIALNLFAVQMGLNYHLKKRNTINQWIMYIVSLYVFSVALFSVMSISNTYVQLISRRLANFTYVAFVMSYVSFFVATALLFELVYAVKLQAMDSQMMTIKKNWLNERVMRGGLGSTYLLKFTSVLLGSIDRNALVHFLFSNIATGAVNFLIKTIYTTHAVSLLVLFSYTLLTCLLPLIIELKRFQMKL